MRKTHNLFKEIDKTTLDAYFEANKDVENHMKTAYRQSRP